jgi:hypothetical protein
MNPSFRTFRKSSHSQNGFDIGKTRGRSTSVRSNYSAQDYLERIASTIKEETPLRQHLSNQFYPTALGPTTY